MSIAVNNSEVLEINFTITHDSPDVFGFSTETERMPSLQLRVHFLFWFQQADPIVTGCILDCFLLIHQGRVTKLP